jgi:N12 class adenine-specific DNA methylase
MFDGPMLAAIVAVLALLLNIGMSIRGGAWGMGDRLSAMEGRIMTVITENRTSVDANFQKLKEEFDNKIEDMQRHIHGIETWSRDEFIRAKTFEAVLSRVETILDRLDVKLDAVQAEQTRLATNLAQQTNQIRPPQ